MGLFLADEPVKSVVAFPVFNPPCSEHRCGHTVFSVQCYVPLECALQMD
jgi:hypothetical protein